MSVTDYLKALTLKDFFYMAGTAWGEVMPKTINNCWMYASCPAFQKPDNIDPPAYSNENDDKFFGFTQQAIERAEKKLKHILHRNQLLDFLATEGSDMEEDCPTSKELTVDELAREAVPLEEEKEEPQPQQPIESAAAVVEHLQCGLSYLERCGIANSVQLMQLNNLIYLVKKDQAAHTKQQTIKDFFQ